jgi:transcription antitermination factor NusG
MVREVDSAIPSETIPVLPKWFAIYTLPRHEKRVAQHCQIRQIEHYLPLYSVQRRWKNGLRQIVQFPLFPNYLFVKVTRKKRSSVLDVPGVVSIVGDCNEHYAVSDNYMQFLQMGLVQGKIEPHTYLESGEEVHIKSGFMAGMKGVLVRKKSGLRVVVNLELIRRSVVVELDSADLELSRSALLYRVEDEALSA